MADYQSNVELKLTGDATQLNTTLEQSKSDVAKAGSNIQSSMGKSGKDAGEKFGQQLFQAQKKWLTLSQDLLRKYGGSVGRVLADVLGQFDKLREAQRASTIPGLGRSPIGREVSNLLTGTAAGAAAGAAAGSVVGQMPFIESGGFDIFDAPNGSKIGIRDRLSARKGRALRKTFQREFSEGRISEKDLVYQLSALDQVMKKGSIRSGFFTKSLFELRSGAALAGGFISALGVGVAAIATYFQIGQLRAEAFKKELEHTKLKDLVNEINAIKDPVLKTSRILQEFGEDGQKKFRELQETVATTQQTLDDTRAWRAFGETARNSIGPIKTTMNGLLNLTGEFFNMLAAVSGNKVTKEMTDEILKGTARAEEMQAKVDANNAKRIKEEDQRKKDQEKLDELRLDRLEEEMSLADKLAMREKIIQQILEKKNKTLADQIALEQLLADVRKLRGTDAATSPTIPTIGTPAEEAQKWMNEINAITNPSNSPIGSFQKDQQAGLGGLRGDYALSQQMRLMDYKRAQMGLSPMTPEERVKLRQHTLMTQEATVNGKDPLTFLTELISNNGQALPVRPVFSK